MRKNSFSLLFGLILMFTILSCKKENNRITNTTYQVDSVKVENLDANDSSISSITIPIYANFIDSLEIYNPNISENGDSINVRKYLPALYCCGDPYLSELGTIINNKPIKDSIYENKFSHIVESILIRYSYLPINKLDSINLAYKNTFAIYTDLHNNYSKYNYIGNTLHSFTEKEISISDNNINNIFDTILNVTSTNIYNYRNAINNQKDLIGIDLNDLFFNAQIIYQFNISGSDLNLYAPFLILNSRMSYNINSDKLIESIEFERIIFNTSFSINISANYTFDAANNNRVKTMKITSLFNGTQSKTLYTFYYKV